MKKKWAAAETDFLKTHHSTMTMSMIAQRLGRTLGSVLNKASELNLRKTSPWTASEIHNLKMLRASGLSILKISMIIGRSELAVMKKISRLKEKR